jgi:F-type H+-transporting ATPase subunit gamma
MANLKEIKRKIKSVQNTQKTTRAMKLVSTSKLRKAEEVARRSKMYEKKITDVLSDICFKLDEYRVGGIDHKFFSHRSAEPRMVDIIFVTADKGLCGGFNMATIKQVIVLMENFKKRDIKVRLRGIGKKGVSYFKFNEIELLDEIREMSATPNYDKASIFIQKVLEDYAQGVTDKVILVHNGYKNMISQELQVKELVPIDTSHCKLDTSLSMMEAEPEDDPEVLDQLAKKYIEYSMYYALLDSLAAEHSARMQAMDAATKNAKELAQQLTLQYNKARQEAITTELIEIISGMEALR